MPEPRAVLGRDLILFSLLVALLTVFFKIYDDTDPRYYSSNERPRLFLAHALAERASIEVTAEVKRFGWSIDMAEVNGRFYSDKPILLSFMAAPAVAVYRHLTDGKVIEGDALWFVKATTLVPFAILFFWLMYGAVFSFSRSRELSLAIAWSSFLGTPVSTYFTVFFSHSVTAALLLAFFLAVRRMCAAPRSAGLFFTGLLGGLIFINEYQAAVPLAILSIHLFIGLKEKRTITRFIAGAFSIALLFMAYNLAAFGKPISFGVSHESFDLFREMHQEGFYGITWPNGYALADCLWSIKMGVFTLSPFLLFAIAGFRRRWHEDRRETIAIGAVIVSYFYLVSSLSNWHGGWAFGARYLVPAVPLIALMAAYGIDDLVRRHPAWRIAAMTLMLLSCIIFTAANGLRPLIEEIFNNPLSNYYLIALREGFVTYRSVLSFTGATPYTAFLIFAALSLTTALAVLFRFADGDRPVRLTLTAALAFLLLTALLLPHYGERYERKFFYWMMVQNRQGVDSEVKEKLFEGRFRDAAEILQRQPHAK